MRLALPSRCLLLIALLATSAEGQAGIGGCGAASPSAAMEEDRSWLRSDHWLYVLENDGRLVRTTLDGQRGQVISAHAFDRRVGASADVSADGRWIAYGGWIAGQPLNRRWLVDTRSGKEALVLEVPKYHLASGEFSPDGRWLAFMLGSDSRNSDNARTGLHLVGTDTKETVFIGLPPEPLFPTGSRAVSAYWSPDSSALFAMTFDSGNQRGFLEFSPVPNGRWRRIEGTWSPDGKPPRLFRDGEEIKAVRTPHPAAMTHFSELASGDGRWTASIGEDHTLSVTSSDGSVLRAATGSYNDCEGRTIGIHGWVDDQFLIYSLDSTPYILDPASGRQSPLFEDPSRVNTYFW